MKIVIAPDSFKGSLSSSEVAKAITKGIKRVAPTIETIEIPMADGGEGTVDSLVAATSGAFIAAVVADPLMRQIEATYGVLGDGQTAVIEIAAASGLPLLQKDERNICVSTSYGTGELIRHALDNGYRNFIIGLGGSATNDGGAGILHALGAKLLDEDGAELLVGGLALAQLHTIDLTAFDPRIAESSWLIASDVTNPLIGPHGASTIFGPQKGATEEDILQLDRALAHFARKVECVTGIAIAERQGAGAAGGIGGMFQAFFPVTFDKGIDVLIRASSIIAEMEQATLIITGEGKSDSQTLSGKVPFGIAQLAKEYEVPIVLMSGTIENEARPLLVPYFNQMQSIVNERVAIVDAMEHAAYYIEQTTATMLRNWLDSNKV